MCAQRAPSTLPAAQENQGLAPLPRVTLATALFTTQTDCCL